MKRYLIIIGLLCLVSFFNKACNRRDMGADQPETALITVNIDWSNSGITPTKNQSGDYVNKVSLRFFPKDGSTPFDRYIETDVTHGQIMVPLGEYAVVVFNEAVNDPFWSNYLEFSNVNDYSQFSAVLLKDESYQDFYTPQPGEPIVREPHKLASWSIDHFAVTENMIAQSRNPNPVGLTPMEDEMLKAFSNVPLQALTCSANLSAHIQNLGSTQQIRGAFQGLANKVYMASRKTEVTSCTHIIRFLNPVWDDATETHGKVAAQFLTFGPLPAGTLPTPVYKVQMDVILVTGERYTLPDGVFDLTDQVHGSFPNCEGEFSFEVPYTEGGIHVGDWEDEQVDLN
ncbi:MAG: DUF5119 domain-containing protein [Marinifilaceae bacterium]